MEVCWKTGCYDGNKDFLLVSSVLDHLDIHDLTPKLSSLKALYICFMSYNLTSLITIEQGNFAKQTNVNVKTQLLAANKTPPNIIYSCKIAVFPVQLWKCNFLVKTTQWSMNISISMCWTAPPNPNVASCVCCFLWHAAKVFLCSPVSQCPGNTTSPPKGWRGFEWIKTWDLNSVRGHTRYSILRRLVSPTTVKFVCMLIVITCCCKWALHCVCVCVVGSSSKTCMTSPSYFKNDFKV